MKTGVTDAPPHTKRSEFFKPDRNGVPRIAMYAGFDFTGSRAFYQWTYDSGSRKLFALLQNN